MYLVQYILIIIENKIQICIDTIFFQNISLFLPEKYLDFFLPFIVFTNCPFFFIFIIFCCGNISFNLNGLIIRSLLVASCRCRKTPYQCLGSCHILSIGFMAILMICMTQQPEYQPRYKSLFVAVNVQVCQILLVQILTSVLNNKMHHLLCHSCCFLQLKCLDFFMLKVY